MNVLFVTTLSDLGFEEPLGILSLSAMLGRHGHDTKAADATVEEVARKIASFAPGLLAYSCLTPNFRAIFDVLRQIKARFPDLPTVVGGPHATFFPEIAQLPEIDFVIRGEGEHALVELVDSLRTGSSWHGIANLSYVDAAGAVVHNPLRPLVADLDELPAPDRDLLSDFPQFHRADVRSVMASRGCPNHCSYCFNNRYHELYEGLGKRVRLRSVDSVLAECRELKEVHGARMIHFFDDIFPFRAEWITEFAQRYPKEIGLPFLTNTSFNACTKHYVGCLAKAGCKTLLIGVETGNEYFRQHILLRRMKNSHMIAAAKLIHEHGITIYTQNLLGLPYGSLELDLETLRLNLSLRADYAGAYLTQPYPGTKIEQFAIEGGFLDKDAKVEFNKSFYYESPMKTADKEKLERLRVLFPIVVNHTWLFPFIYALLCIPSLPFMLYGSLLHGFKIKTSILRYPMGAKRFCEYVWLFFKRPINRIYTLKGKTGRTSEQRT